MSPTFDALAVLAGFLDPVVVLTRDGIVVGVNRAYVAATGRAAEAVVGLRLSAAWPALAESCHHAAYLHALASSSAARFIHSPSDTSGRLEVTVQPVGSDHLSVAVRRLGDPVPTGAGPPAPVDASHANLHSRMLAHMGTCLRADLGAIETFYQMACILGQLPDVSRATFGTVDYTARTIAIHRDYVRDGASIAGTYPMKNEVTCRELGDGKLVIISDVRTDYRTRDDVAWRLALGYVACVAIPLMRDGVWTATLMVHAPVPRTWTEDEVELIRTAAERTWLAVENARLLQEARHANAAKDRFLAMLSHELRTPLTPVVMMLSALERNPAVPPAVKNDLAMMRRNIDLETRLIDDLLDITRIANGKFQLAPRSVRVHELIEHVCQLCSADAAKAGVELSCQLDARVDAVDGDPARLEQVFWNLAKNAIKFTPAGGRVRIATRDEGPGLSVTVADTGKGIAPDLLPRIFNAFEQGEASITRTYGGLGLGLAISKAIVDLHGGLVRAESDGPDRGATFFVTLPTRVPSAAESSRIGPTAPPSPDRRALSSPRVLLVDDNADTLETMRWLLEHLGMRVTVAAGVRQALAVAVEAEFDVLVSDIGLTDGSGCELVAQIQQRRPLPAIALSGYGMEEDIRRSLEAGFSAHLVKPICFEDLEKVIAEITRPL
jgi:signal transduction histidine kinase